MKTYALVYQAGIANVFAVSIQRGQLTTTVRNRIASEHYKTEADVLAHMPELRGDTRRVVQGDFRNCEAFCRGLVEAGASVFSVTCNMAGDIGQAWAVWSSDLSAAPFSDKFCPVGAVASVEQI